MVNIIVEAKSNWNKINGGERTFLLVWGILNLLTVFFELGYRLNSLVKWASAIPLLIGIVIFLIFIIMVWQAKKSRLNFIFKDLPLTEDKYKKVLVRFNLPLLMLTVTGSICHSLLQNAPIWSVVTVGICWISLGFLAILNGLSNPHLLDVKSQDSEKSRNVELGNEKAFIVLVLGFIGVMILAVCLIYYDLHY